MGKSLGQGEGNWGLPGWLNSKESTCNAEDLQEMLFWFLGWEDPLEKEMVTHSSILPGKCSPPGSSGTSPRTEGSLGHCSAWRHKKLQMTEWLSKGNWECEMVVWEERWDAISYRVFQAGNIWVRLAEGMRISHLEDVEEKSSSTRNSSAKTLT